MLCFCKRIIDLTPRYLINLLSELNPSWPWIWPEFKALFSHFWLPVKKRRLFQAPADKDSPDRQTLRKWQLTQNFAFVWTNDHRKSPDRNHFGTKSDQRLRYWPSSAVYSSPSEWEETFEPKSNSKPPSRNLPENCILPVTKWEKSQIIGSGKKAMIFKSRKL
jgi:hypothetical protein